MICKYCMTDIKAWLNKFVNMKKVYLDKLYFDENKIAYKIDEKGTFISGSAFYETEVKKVRERCPKCGKRFNADVA